MFYLQLYRNASACLFILVAFFKTPLNSLLSFVSKYNIFMHVLKEVLNFSTTGTDLNFRNLKILTIYLILLYQQLSSIFSEITALLAKFIQRNQNENNSPQLTC